MTENNEEDDYEDLFASKEKLARIVENLGKSVINFGLIESALLIAS